MKAKGTYLVGYRANGYCSETRVRAENAQKAKELVTNQYHALAIKSVITVRKPQCDECYGTGWTDNHVTGKIECSSCGGTGNT